MAPISPFAQKRKASVPPRDIEPEITAPLVGLILSIPESEFLDIGEVQQVQVWVIWAAHLL